MTVVGAGPGQDPSLEAVERLGKARMVMGGPRLVWSVFRKCTFCDVGYLDTEEPASALFLISVH